MYKYENIERVHLEISEICNAACPMCARFTAGGKNLVKYMNNDSISYDQFITIFDKEFIKQNKKWIICGVLGDPCTAKDLIPIIDYIIMHNPQADISVETNGGIRNTLWWKEFGKLSSKIYNLNVTFSIDGLSDTNHIYRRNVQWNKVIENLTAFIKSGGNATWQFIRFKHNEHQVKDAKELAKKLGVKNFKVKETNRFRKIHEDEYKYPVRSLGSDSVDYWIYPPDNFQPKTLTNINLNNTTIHCLAQTRKEIYVSAKGMIYPCCFIFSDIQENANIYESFDLNLLQVTKSRSLKDVIESNFFNYIEDSWVKTLATGRIKKCAEICGINNRVTQTNVTLSN